MVNLVGFGSLVGLNIYHPPGLTTTPGSEQTSITIVQVCTMVMDDVPWMMRDGLWGGKETLLHWGFQFSLCIDLMIFFIFKNF